MDDSYATEVDFVIELGGKLTPIEVKWSEHPAKSDARHLITFMNEHPGECERAYVIDRCSRPLEACAQLPTHQSQDLWESFAYLSRKVQGPLNSGGLNADHSD
jgi:hypothetical protein